MLICRCSVAATEEVERGAIRLTLEDGTTFVTTPEAIQLALDLAYRQAVRKVIEPVADDEGIRSLTVSADAQSETVAVADVPAFEIPALTVEDLGESESEVVLRPVNVAFLEGSKWRFNDGESTFHASIEDAGFLSAVEAGSERFAKNDLLRIRLLIRQTRDAAGTLHTDRAVTRVARDPRIIRPSGFVPFPPSPEIKLTHYPPPAMLTRRSASGARSRWPREAATPRSTG